MTNENEEKCAICGKTIKQLLDEYGDEEIGFDKYIKKMERRGMFEVPVCPICESVIYDISFEHIKIDYIKERIIEVLRETKIKATNNSEITFDVE